MTDTGAGGRTKCVGPTGISDGKTDIVLYSFVEADSHAAAPNIFGNHPHLGRSQSTIEIIEVKAMTGE